MPVFGVLFYFWMTENYFSIAQKSLLVIQVCIILVLIPIALFYLLRTLGKADSMMLSEVSQRKIPLLAQATLIVFLISQSIRVDIVPELFFFFTAGFFSTVVAFLLSLAKIKASLHMMGIATLTFFVIGLSLHNHQNALLLIAVLFFLNGLVAASRLQMNAHSGRELAIGFFAAMLPQMALWYFWL